MALVLLIGSVINTFYCVLGNGFEKAVIFLNERLICCPIIVIHLGE
jgi:hypothetical protein